MTGRVLWQAEAVCRALRGWSLHEQTWAATGLSADLRKTKRGDLFIAIDELPHGGHPSVAAAFIAGAAAAVVSRQPKHVPPQAPLIFVEDAAAALRELARAARRRTKSKIIAVSGTAARASVARMLRLALGAVGKTCVFDSAEEGTWGLPLALAALPLEADYGIFGVDSGFSSAAVMELIDPDIAVLADAGDLFAAKELLKGINPRASLIVNRDDERALGVFAKSRGTKKVLSFSESAKTDAYLSNCALAGKEYIVNAVILGKKINYMMNLSSLKEVPYSLAAMLAAVEASGKGDECAAALLGYGATPSGKQNKGASAPENKKNIN